MNVRTSYREHALATAVLTSMRTCVSMSRGSRAAGSHSLTSMRMRTGYREHCSYSCTNQYECRLRRAYASYWIAPTSTAIYVSAYHYMSTMCPRTTTTQARSGGAGGAALLRLD